MTNFSKSAPPSDLDQFLPRPIDALDQVVDDGACCKRHEAHRRDEGDLVPEDGRLPYRQSNARRIYNRRITDILDVAKRDVLLLAAVFNQQRFAVIPHLVDEIESQLLHNEVAEAHHDQGKDEEWKRRGAISRSAKKQRNSDEKNQKSELKYREYALVEKRHLRRDAAHSASLYIETRELRDIAVLDQRAGEVGKPLKELFYLGWNFIGPHGINNGGWRNNLPRTCSASADSKSQWPPYRG
jgi:hypothetical protein